MKNNGRVNGTNGLRALRQQKGYRLHHVAELTGYPIAVVSRDERDDNRLTLPKLRTYAAALDCLIAEITGELPVLTDDERRAIRFIIKGQFPMHR